MGRKCSDISSDIYRVLAIYSIISLFCCFIFFCFSLNASVEITNKINQTHNNINRILNSPDLMNMTEWQKIQYSDSVFMKMIDWGIQRQITWGVLTLTFSSLFLLTLFEIRKEIKQKQQEKEYILLLFAAGILFLVPTCLSAFMIPFYYRMASYYEEQLRSIFIPTTFFYNLVKDWYIIELVATAFSLICSLIALKN